MGFFRFLVLATVVLLGADGCRSVDRSAVPPLPDAPPPASAEPTASLTPTAPASTGTAAATRAPRRTATPRTTARTEAARTDDGVDPLAGAAGWASWALLDRRTGRIRGGGDPGTNSTESMIKSWIAADYLRGLGLREPTAAEVTLLRRTIRDSDDNAAETLYRKRGGDAVIRRMIAKCGLTDTKLYSDWWSLTQMSARDAVRMGSCLADGRAMGPKWTAWLLGEMRAVRGAGRFGIVDVYPVAVKNGWTRWGNGTWHVNCLAVADRWTLSVLLRYPDARGLSYGAGLCRQVARTVVP